jgi:hypothetical protein
MLIGNFCVVPLVPVVYTLYIKGHQYSILDSDEPLTDRNGSASPAPSPESHLYLALFGAPCIPISMFWMAYTTSPDISPWVTIVGSIPFGFGFTTVFVSCYQYLAACYGIWSASALASVNFVRCMFSGAMMFASTPLYAHLGVKWTLTTLGIASTIMAQVPYLLYGKGHLIRRWSKHAVT